MCSFYALIASNAYKCSFIHKEMQFIHVNRFHGKLNTAMRFVLIGCEILCNRFLWCSVVSKLILLNVSLYYITNLVS
jgi:hypothetical protein